MFFVRPGRAALNRTPISNTYFSIDQPGRDVARHPLVKKADVIRRFLTGRTAAARLQAARVERKLMDAYLTGKAQPLSIR